MFCPGCAPSKAAVGRAEAARAWREANAGYVERVNAARRVAATKLVCSECSSVFEGRRDRLTCSSRCKEARRRRLNPEACTAKERRKVERRRERRREGGS